MLELEAEIRKVAEFFDPVSRNAMQNPRINNITGDAREFLLTKGENYDLIVSALVPYKKVDLAVRAYARIGFPLKVIGTGTHKQLLKSTPLYKELAATQMLD